jgi:hypothetical protein
MPEIEKLRNIVAHIERYPENSDQMTFTGIGDARDYFRTIGKEVPVAADNGDLPGCGTTLCAAGWDFFLYGPSGAYFRAGYSGAHFGGTEHSESIFSFAQRDLALSAEQAQALFLNALHADDLVAMIDYLEVTPDAGKLELCRAADRARVGQSMDDAVASS